MKRYMAVLIGVIFIIGLAGCNKGGNNSASTSASTISIQKFRLAGGEKKPTERKQKFKVKESIWILFDVVGLTQKENGEIWIEQDLEVVDPTGRPVLRKPRIIDFHNRLKKQITRLPLNNTINLPAKEQRGIYKIKINVRDNLALNSTTYVGTFQLVD